MKNRFSDVTTENPTTITRCISHVGFPDVPKEKARPAMIAPGLSYFFVELKLKLKLKLKMKRPGSECPNRAFLFLE
jgi:hypothetical protein